MSIKRVAIPSPNYSSRDATSVRLIVIHTAEGATTIESLGTYFANPSSDVSSHTGADDKANTVGEYVRRGGYKAWTAANANPYATQIELCAFAKWGASEWAKHPNMLANCAAWIAEEADYYGIPITKLTASQAQGGSAGVCQHNDLGSWGGGHWDCGSGFPMDDVLDMARGNKPSGGGGGGGGGSQPAPKPPPSSPAFPYPSDNYLGQPDGSNDWHDGHGHGADSTHVRTWQAQMSARGWAIGVDGVYGPSSESICKQFQSEKGLGVDGKVGPKTWGATWTTPTS